MGEFDEHSLIRDAKKGDEKAFDKLVHLYMKKAYAVAFRYMRNDQDTQDMVQEAFLKSYINIKNFDERYKFSSWFFRILVNCCINVLKRESKKSFLFDSPGKDGEYEIEKQAIDKQTLKYNPENDLIKKEKRRIVLEGVHSLPQKQRDVLLLYDIEGFSQYEVSEMLDIPRGSVMSRLFYGRKKLKEYLKNIFNEV